MLLHATLATLVLKNQTPINFVMQPPDYWTGSLCFPKGREFRMQAAGHVREGLQGNIIGELVQVLNFFWALP
jgi:hypothetical protein